MLWKASLDESPRFNKFLKWVAAESGASATIVKLKHLERCVQKKVFRADTHRGDADRILEAVQWGYERNRHSRRRIDRAFSRCAFITQRRCLTDRAASAAA